MENNEEQEIVRRRSEIQNLSRLRQNKVAGFLLLGMRPPEMAERLGVSVKTIYRDLGQLRLEAGPLEEFNLYRAEQLAWLEELRDQLEDNLMRPEAKINLAIKLIETQAALVGTFAPDKKLVKGKFSVEGEPVLKIVTEIVHGGCKLPPPPEGDPGEPAIPTPKQAEPAGQVLDEDDDFEL
ncbi:MAG TPA: hypothetical protein VNY29_12105 [Terriglobales bacterium]|jgi:hypothetical protein|nr:hypothetical protein [Terriglobales bacterium]